MQPGRPAVTTHLGDFNSTTDGKWPLIRPLAPQSEALGHMETFIWLPSPLKVLEPTMLPHQGNKSSVKWIQGLQAMSE